MKYLRATLMLLLCIAVMTSSTGADTAVTARFYIGELRKRYDRIQDYQCRMHEFSIGEGRREERIINYYFKKPLLIRVDILDGNKALDRGSVGVYTGGNKVTGHRGGFIEKMVMSVSKNSRLAKSVRGETIEKSTILAVIDRMEHLVENSTVSIEETDTHTELVFHPFDSADNEGITRDVVWLERDTLFIILIQRYEGEKLVQQAKRGNFIVNAGLPRELFDAHFDSEQLREYGIPALSNDLSGYAITP
jgi:outer membrane lipoprotein-sorting protein